MVALIIIEVLINIIPFFIIYYLSAYNYLSII